MAETVTDIMKRVLPGDEGTRLLVYDDATGLPIKPGSVVKGHPTIGIGRALDVHGLSQAEMLYLVGNDCSDIQYALGLNAWYHDLDTVRQAALGLMSFQLGVQGCLSFHGMIDSLKDKDWAGAAHAALDSQWAKQTPHRAQRVADMFTSGQA